MRLHANRWIAPLAILFLGSAWTPSRPPADSPLQIQFQIVHAFGAAGDGVAPEGVVTDGKGNLYGVTEGGGAYNYGTVYQLSPGANGQWAETILHSFPHADPSDGWQPVGVIVDEAGNLYGTTVFGGANGEGTAFELSPGGNGMWTESILWNFCSLPNCADGVFPSATPTLGPGGILYGIASYGAYQLSPGSGGWTLATLYTFCTVGHDCTGGADPSSGLTLGPNGNLYGETSVGGQCISNPLGCGVAYALHQQTNGQWEEIVLHAFQEESNTDGANPEGGFTFHDRGLYGVTLEGGDQALAYGTVFDLTHGSGQMANEQILWNFGEENGRLGALPAGGVAFNKQGDLFGTTGEGGNYGDGLVYGMKPRGNGQWAYHVLHDFDGTDGYQPIGVTIDSEDNIFGTTGGGGEYGAGVVYELSPVK